MADLNTLKQRLTEAEAAQHNLSIGKGTQKVTVDGDEISYTQADAAKLATYISDLKSQIYRAGGSAADGAVRRRPMRPFVGC